MGQRKGAAAKQARRARGKAARAAAQRQPLLHCPPPGIGIALVPVRNSRRPQERSAVKQCGQSTRETVRRERQCRERGTRAGNGEAQVAKRIRDGASADGRPAPTEHPRQQHRCGSAAVLRLKAHQPYSAKALPPTARRCHDPDRHATCVQAPNNATCPAQCLAQSHPPSEPGTRARHFACAERL